jgi:hypothetical protein
MVQFNLLPNVKLEYVKSQRTKRLLTLVSIVVSIAALVVLMLAFTAVDVVQKKSLKDLNNDIGTYSTKLKNVKDLDKILTVQNQLGTLTGLHDQKPVASRLFTYMSQVTPAQATLNNLQVDFTANTMTIGGSAPSLDVISTYTDTLKATTYTTTANKTAVKAFNSVVLSSFARDDKGATFTITLKFDPIIFQSNSAVQLTVPQTANAGQSSVFDTGGQ